MNAYRKIKIKRLIAEFENIYPDDDLIISYADYIRERHTLGYHQFNPNIFQNLLKL